nr:hypothetical protein B0A51_02584 [Rachicladosporium sp. CCFEE 5018]
MQPGTALLPKVFPKDAIQLGRLVPIPLEPTVRAFEPPADLLSEQDVVNAEPEKPYQWTGFRRKEAHGNMNILRLLRGSANAGRAEYTEILAEEGQYAALKDSDAVFRKLCQQSQTARIWMQDMAVYGRPFYIVIGLQTIKNAEFRCSSAKGGAFEAGGSIPLEHSQVLQLCVDAGASDFAANNGKATTSGVLGIEVRRVDCQIRRKEQKIMQRQQQKDQQNSALPVVLTDTISWAYSIQRTKGGPAQENTEEVALSLSTEEVDAGELEALYRESLLGDEPESE